MHVTDYVINYFPFGKIGDFAFNQRAKNRNLNFCFVFRGIVLLRLSLFFSKKMPQIEYPKYISEKGIENLHYYKYNGVDNSFCARLFLNSYWEFVVSKIPTWIAPNVLTLCGLGFMVFGAILSIVYSPTYTEEVPGSVALTYAIIVFLYQTADNIDGKQARRTKSGSPLGELFDHGVDAIVMGLTMMMISSVLHAGNPSSIIMSILGIAAYWFSHWEEYHEGILVMGEFTGPTELNLYEIALYLIYAVFGPELFSITIMDSSNITVSNALQFIFCVSSLATIGRNIYGVYKCIDEKRDACGCTSFVEALEQIIFHVLFIVFSIVWVLLTPFDADMHPHWYMLAVTMGSAYMSQRLITQRVCKEPIAHVKSPVIIMGIAVLNAVLDYSGSRMSFDTEFVLYDITLLLMFIEGVFVVSTIKQMCDALNIEPFKIKPALLPTTTSFPSSGNGENVDTEQRAAQLGSINVMENE